MSVMQAVKNALVSLLSCLDPNESLGTPLFDALARVTVTLAVEVIPWRSSGSGEIEIWISRRKPNESDSGLYHSPGTVVRYGEDIEDDSIPRLARKEMGEKCRFSSVRFIGNLNNRDEARGHFFTPVYIAQIEGSPEDGEWWPINALPPTNQSVEEHSLRLWPMAIDAITAALSSHR